MSKFALYRNLVPWNWLDGERLKDWEEEPPTIEITPLGYAVGMLVAAGVVAGTIYGSFANEAMKDAHLKQELLFSTAMSKVTQTKNLSEKIEGLTFLVDEALKGNQKAQNIIPPLAAGCGVVMNEPVYSSQLAVNTMMACGMKFAPSVKP